MSEQNSPAAGEPGWPEVVIADATVTDPWGRLTGYAARDRTLNRYDLRSQEDPFGLSRDEVERTRVIASRIGDRELAWFLERGRSAGPLWAAIEPDADLGGADPAERDGLYDRADALYRHFHAAAPRGVNVAKISKVLHLKRPALFPILDSHLLKTYRRAARRAAHRHPGRGYRYLYWAAIRDDLLRNRAAIAHLKSACAHDDRESVRRLSRLTDLRVLDILTW